MDDNTYKQEVSTVFGEAAAGYDRLGVEFFTPMGRRLIEHAAPGQGQRVLDIGCGRGAALFPAAEAVGTDGHVLGIDIAPRMIEEARTEAYRQGMRNVALRVMDGEYPDVPQRSFDLVTGSYSVIFMPSASAALQRYAQVLKKGGRIAFTSPVFTEGTFPFLPPMFTELIPTSLLSNLPPQWHPDELRRRFNSWLEHREDLERAMQAAGFTSVWIVDENVMMVAESGQSWVDWSHTQGMRLLWQNLTEPQRHALSIRLSTALDAMRVGNAPLTIDTPVRYVTATAA